MQSADAGLAIFTQIGAEKFFSHHHATMPAPLCSDIRERVRRAIDEGRSDTEISRTFYIDRKTALRWRQHLTNTGTMQPLPMGGNRGQEILDRDALVSMAAAQIRDPAMTADDLRDHGVVPAGISDATISRARHKMGLSFMKTTGVDAKTRLEPRIVQERRQWRQKVQRSGHPKWLLFQDETSFYMNESPHYGWSLLGKSAKVERPKDPGTRAVLYAAIGWGKDFQPFLVFELHPPERESEAESLQYGDDAPETPERLVDSNGQSYEAETLQRANVRVLRDLSRRYGLRVANEPRAVLLEQLRLLVTEGYRGRFKQRPGGGIGLGGRLIPYRQTKERFRHFVIEAIVPRLGRSANKYSLMVDNASHHGPPSHIQRSALQSEIKAQTGLQVLFLPPRSPTLNPAELLFSKVKHLVRKQQPRTFKQLQAAIDSAFGQITQQDIRNWIVYCGYLGSARFRLWQNYQYRPTPDGKETPQNVIRRYGHGPDDTLVDTDPEICISEDGVVIKKNTGRERFTRPVAKNDLPCIDVYPQLYDAYVRPKAGLPLAIREYPQTRRKGALG